MAIVKKNGNGGGAIMKWEDELAKYAQEASDKEQTPAGNFVSLRGGQLTIAGQKIKDNKAQVIIIDHIYENTFYEGSYDPENPTPPACYAFGREQEGMHPHEKSSDPQNEQCEGCQNNVFGSADKGKGKACKNTRRLALLAADPLTESAITDGEVFYMKVPVTSTKAWAFYVKALAAGMKRPPFAVVTEIGVVPDQKSQFKVTFNPVGEVPNELMAAIIARHEKVKQEIEFPYADKAPEKQAKPVQLKKGRKY